jgi:hypothetical protein
MSTSQEHVIDGEALNKLLDTYNLEAHQPTMEMHRLLASQVFEIMEKKVNKGILDEIDKTKPQSVKFVNLEALATGPHKDYLEPISAGIAALIVTLQTKGIQCVGTIQSPWTLPWHLVARLDKNFKGLPAPGQTTPP